MTNETPINYLKLMTADAQKLGRDGGSIRYLLLTDVDRTELYVSITANSASGYFSREITPISAIEACLPEDRSQPVAAKIFRGAVVSKTANQPSFIACICRAEGLLLPVEGSPYLHQISDHWSAWKAGLLAMDAEPYVPPVKEGQVAVAVVAVAGITRQEHPDADTDGLPRRRKGKKGQDVQPASATDELEHAHPA